MCTDKELKDRLVLYAWYSNQYSRIAAIRKELQEEIIAEMDARAAADTASEKEKDFIFMDKKIITERMQESATKAGKELIKKSVTSDVDKYLTVSLARYINPSVTRYF